ncbi:MAG: SUMF1/EgtB/PvdO family nonheme iron enzyme [Acidobacteria bacterium]|nr:SUMF1/EgtB/PvdO family nonheme iron enzyme [Acidobacteriota bacterium]
MLSCPACGLADRAEAGPCPRCGAPPRRPAEDRTTVPLVLPPEIGPGYLLHGNYRIVKELGKGGFGRVFLARDQGLERDVAVKFLTLERVAPTEIPAIKERFRREAQALARYSARTRHVVSVALVGDVAGLPFFVMECLSEGTLHDRINQRGLLPPLEAASLVADVAAALGFVHADGSIHRDIKPANIFVRAGQAVLGDFGIAKIADMPALTTSNPPLTPQYAAPEVIKFEASDHRADLFSLGCVLHECLTGSLLFDGDSYREVAGKIGEAREVDLSPLQYTVPLPLIDVLRRSLAKKAAERYPTAAAMEKDLREIVQRRSGSDVKPAKPIGATVPIATAPPVPEKLSGDRTLVDPRLKMPGGTRVEAGPTRRVWDPIVEPPPSRKGRWIAGALIAAIGAGVLLWLALRPETHPSALTGTDKVAGTVTAPSSGRAEPAKVEEPPPPKTEPAPSSHQGQAAAPAPAKPAVETTGSLAIESVPPGAAIDVDREWRGSAPKTIPDLSVGSHVVKGELRHYQTAEQSARIDAGKTTRVTLTLVPSPGRLSVTSNPSGAAVSIDGNPVPGGTTPWTGSVAPGVNHDVVISKKGFVPEKRSARVESDGEQPVSAELRSEVVEPALRITGADGAAMVLVPAGEFLMGSGSSDGQAEADERPQHRVTLNAFYIDRYEVTNGQYATFLKSARSHTACDPNETRGKDHTPDAATWNNAEWNGTRQPVVNVDWYDAAAYCGSVGKRLPTEAEWEKAARGTDGRIYPWGNDAPGAFPQGNFADESAKRKHSDWTIVSGYDDGFAETAPVGSFPRGASPYGAEDMAGNVWEWVRDWYDAGYYAKSPSPMGPSGGTSRVLRGGSWSNVPRYLRSAYRNSIDPAYRYFYIGFRCAQDQK